MNDSQGVVFYRKYALFSQINLALNSKQTRKAPGMSLTNRSTVGVLIYPEPNGCRDYETADVSTMLLGEQHMRKKSLYNVIGR